MGNSKKLILWGLGLALTGWLIVFLNVIDIIPKSIALSFFAYLIFIIGFTMGMFAMHTQIQLNRIEKAHKELMDKQWDYDDNGDDSEDKIG